MPYEIAWEQHGACRRCWGFVSQDDISKSFRELHEYPNYDQLWYILNDHTEMTGRDWGRGDLLMLWANHLGASVGNPELIDIVVTADRELAEDFRGNVAIRRLPNPMEFFETLAVATSRVAEIVQMRCAGYGAAKRHGDGVAESGSADPARAETSSAATQEDMVSIAAEHEKLARLLRATDKDLGRACTDGRLMSTCSRLQVVLTELFAREEAVIKLIGMPDSEQRRHIVEHDRLLAMFNDLHLASLHNGNTMLSEFYQKLRGELQKHISGGNEHFVHGC